MKNRLANNHPLTLAIRKNPHLAKIELPESPHPYSTVPSLLVERGFIPREEMLHILEDFYEVPVWNLGDLKPVPSLLTSISRGYCQDTNSLPLVADDREILVAMADPWDQTVLLYYFTKTGKRVYPLLALSSDLQEAISRFYSTSQTLDTEIKGIIARQTSAVKDWHQGLEVLEDKDAPVVRLVDYILQQAMALSASDIHLEPHRGFNSLRYRVDGVLHFYEAPPPGLYDEVVSRIKVLANMNVSETRIPQDGRITYKTGDKSAEFRVSVMRFARGEGVVLRLLDKTGVTLDIRKIGFPDDLIPSLEKSFQSPHGLILATGPTGSGKSTTLYAILKEIATPEKKVISVEDPMEFEMDTVCQSTVRADIGYTFASGMRSILRHDPDIVMIGEMRDKESSEIAVQAALTGHLVLSSLHTNDSVSAVTRLVDMGIQYFLVSATVKLVLAQRLVRVLCPHCKTEKIIDSENFEDYGLPVQRIEKLPKKVTLYEPAGCKMCQNIGYKGRIAVFEVLDASNLFRHIKDRSASLQELTDEALKLGLRTLRVNGLLKVLSGTTSLEEIMKITSDY